MNGYFQLAAVAQGVFLKVYPPKDGGEPVTTQMVLDYLDMHKLKGESIIVDKAVRAADGNPVRLSSDKVVPIHESYKMTVSDDKMHATAFFYAPMEGAKAMDKNELLGDLKFHKIVHGINQAAIDAYFKNHTYCTEIELANGTDPRQGTDAEVTYHFNTDLHARPTMNADGTVDYHNLNLINHCSTDAELATLTPEDPGDNGTNIFGEPVKPRKVKVLALHPGKNTRLSEDHLHLYATKTGHVILDKDHVTVSDVMSLENVDLSTGNITYDGSIEVKGVVAAGFEVKCAGNVVVKGIVEGALIEAGGDVILERGINGMGRGVIKAGRNVITKFIENAEVNAAGSITAESIIQGRVTAGTEISVSGKRGNITAGHVTATEQITVKTLGSEMGTTTVVEVGVNPGLREQIKEAEQTIGAATKQLQTIEPTIAGFTEKIRKGALKPTPDQLQYIQKLMAASKMLHGQIEEKTKEMEELQGQLSDVKKASVKFSGIAYPGTQIVIGSLSQTLKKEYKYGKFFSDGGDVRYTAL
ncbi:MAG: FapA family protein [Lachnospiraceae bacterium]|nr:FapA family protein [Lachnospiraceae bacterium]